MGEYEDASKLTDDDSIHASNSQREIQNVIFISENLEKQDELVYAINKLTINNSGYELNTVNASDAQDDLTRNPDTVTHTSNMILDQNY